MDTLIEAVVRLKELEAKASAPKWEYRETALSEEVDPKYFSNMRIGSTTEDRVFMADIGKQLDLDLVVALRNAAPIMLDVLGEIQEGDADKLHKMIVAFEDQLLTPKPTIDLLRRYQAMATKMEEDRPS